MTRSTVRLGAVLVALYVVAAAATASWAPGRLRPLFDGFGSHPGQYNWVDPPKEFSEGNQRPESARAEVEFDAAGSMPTSASPTDGQALAALVPGALAAHPPDTTADVTLTPVDAATLGPLPAGLRPEGNAYLVAIAYAPSGDTVTSLEKPGSVGLTSAAPADTLLYSADGKTWETQQGQPLGANNGISGALAAPGYYLAAAKGAPRATGDAGSGSGGKVVLIVAAVAVPLVLAWLLLSRRRPAPSGRGRPGAGRSRQGTAGGRRPAGQRPQAKGGRATGSKNKGKGGKGPPPRKR